MDLATATVSPQSLQRTAARVLGLLIAALAAAVAGLLAAPDSASDLPGHGVQSVYPAMIFAQVLAMAAAGVTATCLPRTARAVAVIGAVAGMQVAGIAVVASRDWYNYAGAGNASYTRAAAGSQLSLTMAAVAAAAVAACLVLYRHGPGEGDALPARAGRIVTGVVVLVGLPLLLSALVGTPVPSVVGQFALWWSLPWGVAIIATGSLRTAMARRAAGLSVAGSVLVVAAAIAAAA
jgi:hypothetical protein